MQLLEAQLNAFISVDLAIFNKQHFKLFALLPVGRFIAPSFSFPSSKEHFDLLKSLGPDRAFSQLTIHTDTSIKPHKTTGAEILFKNGSTILLGAKVNNTYATTLSQKVKSILIEALLTNPS